MVAKGLGNKEIAGALNIAEVTVKLHVNHVLEKLGVKDRIQAGDGCTAARDHLARLIETITSRILSYTEVVLTLPP